MLHSPVPGVPVDLLQDLDDGFVVYRAAICELVQFGEDFVRDLALDEISVFDDVDEVVLNLVWLGVERCHRIQSCFDLDSDLVLDAVE